MNTIHPPCPFSAPVLRFLGYHLFGDFEYAPNPDGAPEHLVSHYHIENPDPLQAREKVMHEINGIKAWMEQGSNDPCYRYQYQGLRLEAIYEILYPAGGDDDLPRFRKIRLLDGNPTTEDELRRRFGMEDEQMGTIQICS